MHDNCSNLRIMIKSFFYTILFSLFISSCANTKKTNSVSNTLSTTHTLGTIKDNSQIGGCSYVITLDNETNLEPLNLDSLFMQDGLKVYFQYKKSNAMTICMAGQPINILDIIKAKN